MTDKVYRIRRSDGLFSTGGCDPRFTKTGKTWSSIGHLRSHLTMIKDGLSYQKPKVDRVKQIYGECEIVTYEVTVSESVVQPVVNE